MAKLAINGGASVRTKLFPAYNTIGEEEKKAVNFLANLWKENSIIPATPLNLAMSRFELARVLYDMSPDRSNARENLVKELERLRQEQ